MGCDFGFSAGWFGMGFGLIANIAFAILAVVGIVWAFKYLSRNGERFSGNSSNALAILQQRYAKGELSGEEYQRMKKEIE